jgi:hypothetical protein
MTIAAPSYYGSELDADSLEILTIQRIDARLLACEPALMRRKWFDYRPLHPAQATYLMVHHYNRAYGDFIGQTLDVKRRFTQVIKGKDFMTAREVKSFWRLRQRIDELGVRYEFFLRAAMAWLIERGWGKGSPHPPRPAQLLREDEMVQDICNAWHRECKAKIQYAQHPRYQVANWVAAPDQQEYEQWIVSQVKARAHPRFALASALYEFDALRIEAAIEHFPDETLREAIASRLD